MGINTEALTQLRRVVAEHADGLDMRRFSDCCGTVRCAAGWFAGDDWARANTVIGEAFGVDGDTSIASLPAETLRRVFGEDVDVVALFVPSFDARFRRIAAAEVISRIDLTLAGKPIDCYPSYEPEAEHGR